MANQKVRILDYHRNGICGLGFHVAVIEEVEGGKHREMLVIRFADADKSTGSVVCAAFDLAKLDQREVRFFHNSWRGDHYADAMDRAIAERNRPQADGTYQQFYDAPTPGFERSKRFAA